MKFKHSALLSIALISLTLSLSIRAENKVITTSEWEKRLMLTSPDVVVSSTDLDSSEPGIETLRLVLGETATSANSAYLQWVDGAGEAMYSLGLREFNADPTFSLEILPCEKGSCDSFVVLARHVFEGAEQRFELTSDGIGRYSVGLVD